jgi:ankyrin repeat protein
MRLQRLLDIKFPASWAKMPKSIIAMKTAMDDKKEVDILSVCHLKASEASTSFALGGRDEVVQAFYEILGHEKYRQFLESENMVQVFIDEANKCIADKSSTQLLRFEEVKAAILSTLQHGEASPLHDFLKRAASYSDPEAKGKIALLLSLGFSASIQNSEGNTPLHYSLMLNQPRITPLLVAVLKEKRQLGPLLAFANSQAELPLHLAAAKGYYEVLKSLLEIDASGVRANDTNGYTPLHRACMTAGEMATQIVDYLISKGADYFQLDGCGRNAIQLAAWSGQAKALEAICGTINTRFRLRTSTVSVQDSLEIKIAEGIFRDKTALDLAREHRHQAAIAVIFKYMEVPLQAPQAVIPVRPSASAVAIASPGRASVTAAPSATGSPAQASARGSACAFTPVRPQASAVSTSFSATSPARPPAARASAFAILAAGAASSAAPAPARRSVCTDTQSPLRAQLGLGQRGVAGPIPDPAQ